MKKLIAFLLAATLVFSFSACGGKNEEPSPVPVESVQPNQEEHTVEPETVEEVTVSESVGNETEDIYVTGVLVKTADEPEFVLSGLRLDGNRSNQDENGKDFAKAGIRNEFFLDERIEFYLDTDYISETDDVKVVCLPHHPFDEYADMSFDEITEGAAFVETFYVQEPDVECFNPYVFSENFTEGDYDILFTYKGEIVYYTVITLTSEK